MADYENHATVIELLEKAQEAEKDRREKVREVHSFLNDPDGQWEDEVRTNTLGRPRYTFDRCNDMVDDIAGEIEQADFDIRIKPASGEATKELAQTYDGLIRNIETVSNASKIYSGSARNMVAAGIDGWMVSQRWGDNDSFDQELFIDHISDFVDRVWFDPSAELQTKEDAMHAFLLQSIPKGEYEEKFPEGSGQSVKSSSNEDRLSGSNSDVVVVGQIYYKVKVSRRIVEMSNGSVFVDDEKYAKIKDELARRGVTEVRERNRDAFEVKTRLFDGKGFLKDTQDTVFDLIPIIPTYGNYKRIKNEDVYWGIVSKKMDAQRVYNYVESRKVEETALAPLSKILATTDQIGANKPYWAKLNTSRDPALPYQHIDGQPPPFKIGGAELNAGLETVAQSAERNLQSTAGLERITGEALGLQSGVALELQQNKGDTRNYKYSASQEVAICHTAKILINALPKVMDTKRQVRILNEDESFEMIELNTEIIDEQTGELVKVNDLSKGFYDVTCSVGPAFKNRQSETVEAFNEIAAIDPTIMEEGGDIWLKNINAPGMDLVAERRRERMLLSGMIPESQMTDEEKDKLASMPEQQPSPVEQALMEESQANTADIQSKIEERDAKIDLQAAELAMKEREHSMTEAMQQIKMAAEELNIQAQTLKQIKDALGIDVIATPEGMRAIQTQLGVINDSQAEQP